ncbi:unnamed protein product [Adineta ricciae]|uniref:Uncharacterized protein n=1 Tax=Adineta ricciae TaxID=249248 RepID=A0A814ZQ73_ADIRI|nr:unnamed protein product [Adineta ricciae]
MRNLHVIFLYFTEYSTNKIIGTTTIGSTTTVTSTIVQSTYSSALDIASAIYIRPDDLWFGGFYYYQAIEINVITTGMYSISSTSDTLDTQGFLYNGSFNTSFPGHNLILFDDDSGGNKQFILIAHLQKATKYILFITTYLENKIGAFTITASGPAIVTFSAINLSSAESGVVSNYSSSLTTSSQSYNRLEQSSESVNYYQAIEISVSVTGVYTIGIDSSMDTYGYLYNNTFDSVDPNRNLLLFDDDSGGNGQFMLKYALQATQKYILIATTYDEKITGEFSVTSLGPSTILFSSVNSTVIRSEYSSYLAMYSEHFTRPFTEGQYKYFYTIIETHVSMTRTYRIRSSGLVDTFAYLYLGTFDPALPTQNLVFFDNDSGGNRQFMLTCLLQTITKYLLVVTTANQQNTGSFSIIGLGEGPINFAPLNISNSSANVESMYSSSLTNDSHLFCRENTCSEATYYYQAVELNISITGTYILFSSSGMDTVGYLYQDVFNASSVQSNLINFNDDGSIYINQFMLQVVLEAMTKYILVVTTYNEYDTGSFSIVVLGDGTVGFAEVEET